MTTTATGVLAGLDRCILNALARGNAHDAAILESVSTRIAALVEAARVFDQITPAEDPLSDDFPCRIECTAGQLRALSSAIKRV